MTLRPLTCVGQRADTSRQLHSGPAGFHGDATRRPRLHSGAEGKATSLRGRAATRPRRGESADRRGATPNATSPPLPRGAR
ncbi:hypothetical protein DA2_2463 [Desulfovibrio sp. A2]|nr:hypothetical protein DA2_2463 [Desulfovibrio sp. A2]